MERFLIPLTSEDRQNALENQGYTITFNPLGNGRLSIRSIVPHIEAFWYT